MAVFGLDPFPWWLDLIALVLGGVAFLMAVQPFIQAFIEPKLQLGFDTTVPDGAKLFRCIVENKPLKNRLGRLLRVRRPIATAVHAFVRVQEIGSDRVVYQWFPIEWARHGTQYYEHVADIPAFTQGFFFTFAVKYPGYEKMGLCDGSFSNEELDNINQAIQQKLDVSQVFTKPLPLGVFRVSVHLYNERLSLIESVILNNEGASVDRTRLT